MKLFRGRRMSTAERREIQRSVASDPKVDAALRKLLDERPEFRMKGTNGSGISGQPGSERRG